MVHKNKLRTLALMLVMFLGLLILAPQAEATGSPLAVERQIYAYLTEKMGLNTAVACGILANIEHESAFQPTVVGDKGTSFGLCQWHNERWTSLRTFCNLMGMDYRTVEGQMEYLRYELGNKYTNLLLTLKSLDNTPEGAYQAAYLWCTRFEMPSNMEVKAAQRGNLARGKYWNRYNRPSISILPEEEPEIMDPESITQQLIQQPVTVPLPPRDENAVSDRRYHPEKPELITYIPRHLPQQPQPEEGCDLVWGISALMAIGLAAVTVVIWPGAPKRKKQGHFEKV